MNFRSPGTAPKSKTGSAKSDGIFASEVYDEEDKPARKDNVSEELAQLRAEFRGEARALRSAISRPRVPAELLAELASLRATVDVLLTAPKKGTEVAAYLRARGIEGPAAVAFERAVKDKDASGEPISDRLCAAMTGTFPTGPSIKTLVGSGPSVIALVGPAGVGKTTTAAKLAAQVRMARKTVSLVSCDAYRVGAMDQLGKYAELLDANFYTATTADELLAILKADTSDVIIVDTSGRAVEADATEFLLGTADVRNVERFKRRVDVLLCVPAALRATDAGRVSRDFASTKPTALAITKVDETDAPAGIAHAVFATKLPVSLLCTGQRVPEDIEDAMPSTMGDRLFPPAVEKAKGVRAA